MLSVRPARPCDVQKFCRIVAPMWFIGVVAEDEAGDVIGAGWVVWGDENRPWVCFEGDSEIKAHKALIARWSARLVRAAQAACDELYTIEDRSELNGSRWLEWLGFRDTGEVRQGNRILKWQKHSSHLQQRSAHQPRRLWMSDIDVQSGQRYVALSSGSALVKMDPWDDGSTVRTQNASIYMDNVQFKTDIGQAYVENGLYVTGVDGLYISNSHIGFTKYVIRLSPFDADANIQHIFYNGGYVDGNVGQSDYLLYVTDALTSPPHTGILKDVSFVNCGFIRPSLKGIVIDGDTCEKFKFSVCEFEGGDEDAIQIGASGALSNSVFSGCIFENWNRDASGSAWEVRFLSGNTSDNILFSDCQFLSGSVTNNVAFAGSENDIRFDNCKYSKTTFGGTISGKNLKNTNAEGITTGLSENYGLASISPDANGAGTITHGLFDTPTFALVGLRGDSANEAEVTGYGGSSLSVRIHNAAGADVTAGTFNIHWMAKV